jgi:hypothetical protein
MDTAELIEALSDPAAYPEPVDAVDVRHTHNSVVFLAGRHVYKLKKPVALGFLDFGTPERRRHFCAEEVRLNRRLAPDVYLGIVPVARSAGSRLRFEGRRVLVDASFRAESDRRTFLAAAGRWAVPAVSLICRAPPEVVRRRLRDRRNDVSDADWSDHLQLAAAWDEPAPDVQRHMAVIDTEDLPGDALARAVRVVAEAGLVGPP